MRISRTLAAVSLALSCAGSAVAQPALKADVGVSSAPVRAKNEPFTFHFEFERPKPGQPSADQAHVHGVGVGAGIREGKPLEMTLWGAGGAMIGIIGGPVGIVVGAAAGAIAGLLVSVFAVPKEGDVETASPAR